MLLSFLYGLIGIILLTAYCLIGAFAVPQIAYWTMTPNAQKLLEEYGISRKFNLKGKISFAILTAVICALYLITIISAGKQGVNSGMNFLQLSIRFVIFFWMTSMYLVIVFLNMYPKRRFFQQMCGRSQLASALRKKRTLLRLSQQDLSLAEVLHRQRCPKRRAV